MGGQGAVMVDDVQVVAKAPRRTYAAEYKRRLLKEADACTTPAFRQALTCVRRTPTHIHQSLVLDAQS